MAHAQPSSGLVLRRRLTIVAGKGGGGTTTIASALAAYAAQHRTVLLLSTDPAHSLNESLTALVGSVPIELLLSELQQDAERLDTLLHDPTHTDVVVVSLDEPVVAAETERYVAWLAENRLQPRSVVFNRMRRNNPMDRSAALASAVSEHTIDVAYAPEFRRAPRGIRRLRCLGSLLATGWSPSIRLTGDSSVDATFTAVRWLPVSQIPLQFVVGKGGSGKTTVASLEALALAASRPTLLISLDPAHSLGDVWGTRIGDTSVALAPNLWGIEVDAARRWAALRGSWQSSSIVLRLDTCCA